MSGMASDGVGQGMVKQQSLDALLAASRDADSASAISMWRGWTADEQEEILLQLLGLHHAAGWEVADDEPAMDSSLGDPEETAAMAPVAQTELVPKIVDDLRGLTASDGDSPVADDEPPLPIGPSAYWSRWLRRWKISAVVAAWAVTTAFAFTTETSSFGPQEWMVALFGTVVLGGGLVGTLANFAVAAIPTQDRPASGPSSHVVP